MSFSYLLKSAKAGNKDAFESLLKMYRPLLMKESIIDGVFDEDLFQEQCIVLMKCIKAFK